MTSSYRRGRIWWVAARRRLARAGARADNPLDSTPIPQGSEHGPVAGSQSFFELSLRAHDRVASIPLPRSPASLVIPGMSKTWRRMDVGFSFRRLSQGDAVAALSTTTCSWLAQLPAHCCCPCVAGRCCGGCSRPPSLRPPLETAQRSAMRPPTPHQRRGANDYLTTGLHIDEASKLSPP